VRNLDKWILQVRIIDVAKDRITKPYIKLFTINNKLTTSKSN